MTFRKIGSSLAFTLKAGLGVAVAVLIGATLGALVGSPLCYLAKDLGPSLVGAAIGGIIGCGLFAHKLDSNDE
jgi:hypothetical protein